VVTAPEPDVAGHPATSRPGRVPASDTDPPSPARARTKRNVLGVLVDAVDYKAAVDGVLAAAREGRPFALTALAVHGLMTAVLDKSYQSRLNTLDLVTPDGQPVRWALNMLHDARLRDWVSGPELVIDVLREAAQHGVAVYLYGSTPQTLQALTASLHTLFPELSIAGVEPSKFRSAAAGELTELAERISRSGARIVLVGLGCPRQEIFVHEMRPLLRMPLLAVGAAFDYHAGQLRRAPEWMRRRGLSWFWRLACEPRRLWRRYLLLNPAYLAGLLAQTCGLWRPQPHVGTHHHQAAEPVPL
jgi:N-acetylglucosaminyldiphosphoundecaprenol N-acetyl-beta-D-mannosaminyltransferase